MAVRRVRRVVRKFDPWTVLKVSIVLNAIGGLIFVLGIWVAWSLAIQRGIPDKISEILADFSIAFTAEGELYFRVVVFFAIVLAVGATGLMTLGAVLYNLISDMVGGVEVIVLEETYNVTPTQPVQSPPARMRAAANAGAVNGSGDDVDTEPVRVMPDR
jgi:hypothetical protein